MLFRKWINRTLHGRLGIRILSSRAESMREDKIRIPLRPCSILYFYCHTISKLFVTVTSFGVTHPMKCSCDRIHFYWLPYYYFSLRCHFTTVVEHFLTLISFYWHDVTFCYRDTLMEHFQCHITVVKWYQGRKCFITVAKCNQGRKCSIKAVKWYQGRKCSITIVKWYLKERNVLSRQ